MSEPRHDYQLFGLRIASDIELPELAPLNPARETDLRIRLGEVPPGAMAALVEPIAGGAMLTVNDVARFAVTGGSTIRVDPCASADTRNVRLFLLGSAMGLLLHQRGLLPLHANAIEVDGRAILFMGESGAGKSTLAAWFHDRGRRVIADDVVALSFENRQAVAHPGVPRLRLWRDALERSGRSPLSFEHCYAGDASYDKFNVPVPNGAHPEAAVPVGAIYELVRGDPRPMERLDGVAAVEAIFANTYRGACLPLTGGHEAHWRQCLRLVHQVPVYRLSRPRRVETVNLDNEALLADLLVGEAVGTPEFTHKQA